MAFRRILIALCALLFLLPAGAGAQTFPPLTGRVVDAAHVLAPEQVQALDAKLAAFEQSTKQQLVVATVPDLQGYDVSDYAYQLGRAWGIGQKDVNNGVVLLVAPNDRKMWISTGYGVEGVLTDAVSAQIYRRTMVPRFKAGDIAGGIDAGVDAIIQVLQLPPDEQRKLAAEAAARPKSKVNAGDVFKAIAIVLVVLAFILFSAIRAASRGGRRYRSGRGGVSPIVVWAASEALGAALRGGRGDDGGGGWGGGGWGGGGGGGGGFSGGGGSFGGGGAGGGW